MARLFNPLFQAIDGNGAPISGALLNFYITGTTTRKTTYADSGLTTPNTNPVVAGSTGRFPTIYLAQDVDYKAILTDASSVTVQNGTIDPLLVNSTSVISTQGDIIIGNSSGADSRLGIGAANAALRSNGTTASWVAPAYTKQVFLSGSGTYTTPAGCTAIRVRMVGGGGGGGGTGASTGPTGATGGTSSFNGITVNGGPGGAGSTGAISNGGGPGTGGTGTVAFRVPGGSGGGWAPLAGAVLTGAGAASALGGGVGSVVTAGNLTPGNAGGANTGAGGGGSAASGAVASAGGSAGEYAEIYISAPAASYPYAVGGGGAGGLGTGAGTPTTGGPGAAGIVIVEEFYS